MPRPTPDPMLAAPAVTTGRGGVDAVTFWGRGVVAGGRMTLEVRVVTWTVGRLVTAQAQGHMH